MRRVKNMCKGEWIEMSDDFCFWFVSGGGWSEWFSLCSMTRAKGRLCVCALPEKRVGWGSWWYITWLRPGCQQSQIDFRYTMESSNWWHSVLCTVLYCTVLYCQITNRPQIQNGDQLQLVVAGANMVSASGDCKALWNSLWTIQVGGQIWNNGGQVLRWKTIYLK